MTVSTGAAASVARSKVLIVDDEKQVRTITELMLTQFGFEVLSASDGPEALELLDSRSSEVGLVLMDLSMPKMSGEETFQRMRQSRSDVRVVFISGYDESEIKGSRDGVVGFLKKPFELERLLSTVRRGLDSGS